MGYVHAFRLRDGAYWGLISSNFVHLAIWHLAFNLYWLWILGSLVEDILGPLRYLGVVLVAACVNSSAELAVSGSTGLGASGIVYALFGLAWPCRTQIPVVRKFLGPKTSRFFWLWLPVGVLITRAGLLPIGNAGHAGGLVVGLVAAHGLVLKTRWSRAALAGLACLVALSIVPLFWAPWSAEWLAYRAYKAHLAEDYDAAIAGYQRCLDRRYDPAWTLQNLALAYAAQGAQQEYQATLARLRERDAVAAAEVESKVSRP